MFSNKTRSGMFSEPTISPLKIFPVGTEMLTARVCSNACAVLHSSLSTAVVLNTRSPDHLYLERVSFEHRIFCY
jgi:hypothetical protein